MLKPSGRMNIWGKLLSFKSPLRWNYRTCKHFSWNWLLTIKTKVLFQTLLSFLLLGQTRRTIVLECGWWPTRCLPWKLLDHPLGSRTRRWDGWQDIVWFTSRGINFLPAVFRDSTSETFNKVFARKYVKWGEVSRNAMSTLKSLEDWAGQELGVSGN